MAKNSVFLHCIGTKMPYKSAAKMNSILALYGWANKIFTLILLPSSTVMAGW